MASPTLYICMLRYCRHCSTKQPQIVPQIALSIALWFKLLIVRLVLNTFKQFLGLFHVEQFVFGVGWNTKQPKNTEVKSLKFGGLA